MNLKRRQELIDYDYVDKLSETEKDWLNKFTEEYVNASLNRENLKKNIHNTKKLKQDCDRRNYLRKNDIFVMAKVGNLLDNLEEYKSNLLKLEESFVEFEEPQDKPSESSPTPDDSDEDL